VEPTTKKSLVCGSNNKISLVCHCGTKIEFGNFVGSTIPCGKKCPWYAFWLILKPIEVNYFQAFFSDKIWEGIGLQF
jgi:hypothetical protein